MTVDYWSAHPCGTARRAAGISRYDVEPHILPWLIAGDLTGVRVLEVGCGAGEDARRLAQAGADVVAIDPSLPRDLVPPPDVEFRPWALVSIAPEPTYDFVYSYGVLHHTRDPRLMLAMMYDCLHPNGTLKLMVYHKPSLRWLQLWLQHGWHWWKYTERVPGVPISRAYTRGQIRRLVQRAGFVDVQVQVAYICPFQSTAYREGRLVRSRWAWLTDRLAPWLGWHCLVTAQKAA